MDFSGNRFTERSDVPTEAPRNRENIVEFPREDEARENSSRETLEFLDVRGTRRGEFARETGNRRRENANVPYRGENRKDYEDYLEEVCPEDVWDCGEYCDRGSYLEKDEDYRSSGSEEKIDGSDRDLMELREKSAAERRDDVSGLRYSDSVRSREFELDGPNEKETIKIGAPVLGVYFTTNYNKMKRFKGDSQRDRSDQNQNLDRYLVMNLTDTTEEKRQTRESRNEDLEESFDENPVKSDKRNVSYFPSPHPQKSSTSHRHDFYRVPRAPEIPRSNFPKTVNWQNVDFDSYPVRREVCHCPRHIEEHSSNVSIASIPSHRESRQFRPENRNQCPLSCKVPRKELPLRRGLIFDANASNSHDLTDSIGEYYLEHVPSKNCGHHDGNEAHGTKRSSCACLSRKCTLSKASLYVEAGESIQDFPDSTFTDSTQTLDRLDDPLRWIVTHAPREGSTVKRNKSDTSRIRVRQEAPVPHSRRCNTNFRSRPVAGRRSYSDEFPCTEGCYARGMTPCGRHEKTGNAVEKVECRTQTEKSAGNRSCETCVRPLSSDAQRGKFWSQAYDACKNAVRLAAASLGQAIKETAKSKSPEMRAKCIETRDPPLSTAPGVLRDEISSDTRDGVEKALCPRVERESRAYGVREDTRVRCQMGVEATRNERTLREPGIYDNRYWQSTHYSANRNANVVGLHEYRAPLISGCSERYGCCQNTGKQTPPCWRWYFDPHEVDIHEDIYPRSCSRGPLKDLGYPKYFDTRKRGGSDWNPGFPGQRRNNSNSRPPESDTTSSSVYPDSINQRTRRSSTLDEYDRWLDDDAPSTVPPRPRCVTARNLPAILPSNVRGKTYGDVCVQAGTIGVGIQPGSITCARRRVEQREFPRRVDTHEDFSSVGRRDGEKAPASKWRPSTTRETDARQETRSPRKQAPPSPRKHDSNNLSRQGRRSYGTVGPVVGTSKTTRTEGNNRGSLSNGRAQVPSNDRKTSKSMSRGESTMIEERTVRPDVNKASVRCQTIRKYQIICVNDYTEEVAREIEESGFRSSLQSIPDERKTADVSTGKKNGEEKRRSEATEPDKKAEPSAEKNGPRPIDTTVPPALAPETTVDVTPNQTMHTANGGADGQVTSNGKRESKLRGEEERSNGAGTNNIDATTIATAESPTVTDTLDQTTDTLDEDRSAGPPKEEDSQEDPSVLPKLEKTAEDSLETSSPKNGEEDSPKNGDNLKTETTTHDTTDQTKVETFDTTGIDVQSKDTRDTMDPMEKEKDVEKEHALTEENHEAKPRDTSNGFDETSKPTNGREKTIDRSAAGVEGTMKTDGKSGGTSEVSGTPLTDVTAGSTEADRSMEYTREYKGTRTQVNVEMQTSNTILTKILSEYEVGNKKRRILMSVRLVTEGDEEGEENEEEVAKGEEEKEDDSGELEGSSKDADIQTTNLSAGPAVTNQWASSAEYSSLLVTSESGTMEVNGQTERNDEIEYLVRSASLRKQQRAVYKPGINQRREKKTGADKPTASAAKKIKSTAARGGRNKAGSTIVDCFCRSSQDVQGGRKLSTVDSDDSWTYCDGPCGKKKLLK